MVSKKERAERVEEAELEEDIAQMSDEGLNRDMETKNYASEENPSDIYQYKRMRLVPNSETEYRGLIDKDVVLANVKDVKPDPAYLRFVAETIIAMDVFSVKKIIKVAVRNNKGVIESFEDQEVLIPDPEFNIIREFLRGSFKTDLTLSRAMGKEREAVLDRTSNIGKSITKENTNSNKYGRY